MSNWKKLKRTLVCAAAAAIMPKPTPAETTGDRMVEPETSGITASTTNFGTLHRPKERPISGGFAGATSHKSSKDTVSGAAAKVAKDISGVRKPKEPFS